MSSQRLPNKVLHKVAGKPMLQYLLERLMHCNCLDAIVVATSVDDSDTPIAEHCRQHGIAYHRGPLANVAGRFNEVLDIYKFDCFVRVNGDSPLLDQRLIEKGVNIYLGGNFDVVTNTLPRTYPAGQSVEVLHAITYQNAYNRMREQEDLEHVTRYYYRHSEDFCIHNFSYIESINNIRLCVDTHEDMERFAGIISCMDRPHWEYQLEDLLEIYRILE
jgi:spore coat polysaccharide biosynthesis protein SpsF